MSEKLRIAVIAPSAFRIKEDLDYGGAERVVFDLCASLRSQEDLAVTLFAMEGSKVPEGVSLVKTIVPPLQWSDDEKRAYITYEKLSYDTYKDKLKEFAVVSDHSHLGFAYLAHKKI